MNGSIQTDGITK